MKPPAQCRHLRDVCSWLWLLSRVSAERGLARPRRNAGAAGDGGSAWRLLRSPRAAWLADYTLVGRFDALRGALRLLQPGEDFSFVTKPGFVSIRQMLPMNRRDRFVPDSRDAELWAETLFRGAGSGRSGAAAEAGAGCRADRYPGVPRAPAADDCRYACRSASASSRRRSGTCFSMRA